jgi:hypothetical protein
MFKVRPQDNVVFESCLGCFQSQNAWVKNADAPVEIQNAAWAGLSPLSLEARDAP